MAEYAAIHAAEERRKRELRREEQDMTPYSREDLEGDWEFKIVRSEYGNFRKPEALEEMLQTEALGGWQLVEKFDNQRVRLKRPGTVRGKDHLLPEGYDPYGTHYGRGMPRAVFKFSAVLIALLPGVALMLLNGGSRGGIDLQANPGGTSWLILGIITAVAVVAGGLAWLRRGS
ncbi:MAG: hypothetical protein L0Z70_10240 [Chloroflexi bacterium]|nr:hypothetical protein [Chloroflexota bacterium]